MREPLEEIYCPVCITTKIPLLSRPYDVKKLALVITIDYWYYKCSTCGEEFTTTESDTKTLKQLHNEDVQR